MQSFFWRVRLVTFYHPYILGWPKSLFGVFCTMLWKKPQWTFWLTQYFCEYFLPLCNLKLASSLVISDKRCQRVLKVLLEQWLFPDLFLPDSSSLEASSLKLFNGFFLVLNIIYWLSTMEGRDLAFPCTSTHIHICLYLSLFWLDLSCLLLWLFIVEWCSIYAYCFFFLITIFILKLVKAFNIYFTV